jgi:serine/threonine protein kinase
MISKLMVTDEAKAEVDEYKILERIDSQNKYYPGPPEKCDVNPNDKNISESDCSLLEETPDLKDYSLLMYKDGGVDLDDFVEEHLDDYLKKNKQRQTDLFWLNAHNLFKGLRLYIVNNFLHHDIKPSNIVFNPKTYTFSYIDFGLSVLKNDLVKDILNKRDYESFHWSYPLEIGFTNFKKDFYFPTLTKAKIERMEKDFIRLLTKEDESKNDYKIKPTRYTHTTFRYMVNELKGEVNIEEAIKGCMNGIKHYKENSDFESFVNDTVPYLDIYALGFTLNHVLNYFFVKGAVSPIDYARFSALFSSMFDFDFRKRFTDIDAIMAEYEEILKVTGVLSRLHKKFVNHEVARSPSKTSKKGSPANNKKTIRTRS